MTGGGLHLLVKPGGSRSWILRYQVDGQRHDLGLGPFPEVTLADARNKALDARRRILAGESPIAERRRAKRNLTFRVAGEQLIETKRSGWRNAKHAYQWSATLDTYVFPRLGDLDVKVVDTEAVLDVLKQIWTTKPETAFRVRQRIEALLRSRAADRECSPRRAR